VKVPRCYFNRTKKVLSHELHGFSDALKKAYATALVYLRTVYSDGSAATVQLIAAKTRVAPIKKQSIPRLELLGATILARLLSSVRSSLQSTLIIAASYYWVDSFTTLYWIKNGHQWRQYVLHRIAEIRQLSNRE